MSTPFGQALNSNQQPPVIVQGESVQPYQPQQQQQQPMYQASPYSNTNNTNNQDPYYNTKPTNMGNNNSNNNAGQYASPYSNMSGGGKIDTTHSSQHGIQQQEALQKQGGCRDVIWAILFYVHLAMTIYLAIMYGPQVMAAYAEQEGGGNGEGRFRRILQDDNNQEDMDFNVDPAALLSLTGITGILAVVLSSLAMGFMIKFAEMLIKMALIFNIAVFALTALASLAVGALPGALMGGMMCLLAAYYAYKVWARIPFAAANLVTAVTAVRSNMGLAVYAYLSLILLFGWTILWTVSTSSTLLVLSDCDVDGECQNEVSGILVFLFLISFYWTIQVITNVVHVTVAGTVGHWWFVPQEANGCCSQAVRDSYVRSLTTSFGSICLGSLIVAIIQALREILRQMRESDDGIMMACAECLIGCLESLVEYFNKWAFVYVGLYGFSFMEAGKNVMTLFRNRGWTSIITDVMVDTVLMMVSFGVGALTALIGLLIGSALSMGDGMTLGTGAFIGFILGYGMSSTLFSVVSSAVNTVIVCYAEAPNEFQANHAELSNKMRDAWRQAWPNDFGY